MIDFYIILVVGIDYNDVIGIINVKIKSFIDLLYLIYCKIKG